MGPGASPAFSLIVDPIISPCAALQRRHLGFFPSCSVLLSDSTAPSSSVRLSAGSIPVHAYSPTSWSTMNTRQVIDESVGPYSLSAAFNNDASCFSVGLNTGFRGKRAFSACPAVGDYWGARTRAEAKYRPSVQCQPLRAQGFER